MEVNRCARWRRKLREKKILIFVNSSSSTGKAAGLFSFDAPISTSTKPPSFTNYYFVKKPLYPVKAFYDQSPGRLNEIYSVGSCLLGTDLYIIPDDKETSSYEPSCSSDEEEEEEDGVLIENKRLPSYIYNIRSEGGDDPKPIPEAKKWGPLVAAIDNKIFALSAYSPWAEKATGPLFEYLDPTAPNNGWITLNPPTFPKFYSVSGFAVLEDKFLLVSFCGREYGLLSYNVVSNQWKPVRKDYTSCATTDRTTIPLIVQEAITVGHDIYTYNVRLGKLFVFSYFTSSSTDDAAAEKEEEEEFDLSVGSASPVKGLHFSDRFYLNTHDCPRSGVIAKTREDGLLCLVHTLQHQEDGLQDICVTIIKLCDRDSCIQLQSFKLALFVGEDFPYPSLHACHVLDLEETNKHRRVNRATRLHNNDNIASNMEMDCGGNT